MFRITHRHIVGFGLFAVAAVASHSAARAEPWSGPYAGVNLGYSSGDDEVAEVNGARDYYPDTDGFSGGIQAGWNWTHGRIVTGLQAEAGILDVLGSLSQADATSVIDTSADFGGYGALTARLGYLVTPKALVFARAGAVYTQFEATTSESCPAGGPCSITPSTATTEEDTWGYVLGAGVGYAVSDTWTVEGEYQYTNFNDELALPPGAGPGWTHDPDLHTLKVSLNRSF